jgi:ATP-dependent Zn protease
MTMQRSAFLGRFRLGLLVAVVAVSGLALAWSYIDPSGQLPSYPYSAMLADARAGRVVSISQQGTKLAVRLAGESDPRTVFVASEAVNVYEEVCAVMGKQPGPDCGIQYAVTEPSASGQWLGLIITALLPVLLITGFIYFMMRAQQKRQ